MKSRPSDSVLCSEIRPGSSETAISEWLGEAVSIGLLADEEGCYNEPFRGYSLRRFDGTTVTVRG